MLPGKKLIRKFGSVGLWRYLGPKYSAIPVKFGSVTHTHVDTGKPVEQHVPWPKCWTKTELSMHAYVRVCVRA
jgi:hypothetical protein